MIEMNKNKAKKKIKILDVKSKQDDDDDNYIYKKKNDKPVFNCKKNSKNKKYKKPEIVDNYFDSGSCDTYNNSETIGNKNCKLKFKNHENNTSYNDGINNCILSNNLNKRDIELRYQNTDNINLFNNLYYQNMKLKGKNTPNNVLSNYLNHENIGLMDINVALSDSNDNNIKLKNEENENLDFSNNLNKHNVEIKHENVENGDGLDIRDDFENNESVVNNEHIDSFNNIDHQNVKLKYENTENVLSNNINGILQKKNYKISNYPFDKYITEKDFKKNSPLNNKIMENHMLKTELEDHEYLYDNGVNKYENIFCYNNETVSNDHINNYILHHEKNYNYNNNLNHNNNEESINTSTNNINYEINNMKKGNYINGTNEMSNVKKVVNGYNDVNSYNYINNIKDIKGVNELARFSNGNKKKYIDCLEKHIDNENIISENLMNEHLMNNGYMGDAYYNQSMLPVDDENHNFSAKNMSEVNYNNKRIGYDDNQYFRLLDNKLIKEGNDSPKQEEFKRSNSNVMEESTNDIMLYKDNYNHEYGTEEYYVKEKKKIKMNFKKHKQNDNINILENFKRVSEENEIDAFYPVSNHSSNYIKTGIEDSVNCNVVNDEKMLINMENGMKSNYMYYLNSSNNENMCNINNFSKKNYGIHDDLHNLNYMKHNYIDTSCDNNMHEMTDYYNNFLQIEKNHKINFYHSTVNSYGDNINMTDNFKTKMNDYHVNVETQNNNIKNEKFINKPNDLLNNGMDNDGYGDNNFNYINENQTNSMVIDEFDTETKELNKKIKKKEFKNIVLTTTNPEFTVLNSNDDIYKTSMCYGKKIKK